MIEYALTQPGNNASARLRTTRSTLAEQNLRLIPQWQHPRLRVIFYVSRHAQWGRVQLEMLPRLQGQASPPHRQRIAKLAVRKQNCSTAWPGQCMLNPAQGDAIRQAVQACANAHSAPLLGWLQRKWLRR